MPAASLSPVLPAPDVDAALEAVRAAGLRATAARRVLIEALFAAGRPVTAQELAGGLDGRVTQGDIAAIYRNLELLERIGLVRHTHAGHGPALYGLADRAEAEFLRCERCGELQPVAPATLTGVRDAVRAGHRLRGTLHAFPDRRALPGLRRGLRGTRVRRRASALRGALTHAEWRRAGGLAACILALHVVGFGVLIAFVVPHDFALSTGGVFGLSLGITAYTLGMRHAFDADHIGAIDNVTRKLMGEGQRPLSVGFFFALGHSSIVFALGALVAIGVRGLSGAVEDDGSALHQATGLIGPLVSGSFLLAIGLLNLAVLIGVLSIFRRMRHGEYDESELEHELATRGIMLRFYSRATRAVTRPWHMYPLGCLFGLGFDTATEVGLLVVAGGAASAGLPWYAILCLPVLFAAGMTLLDTLDGAFMSFAYGWAFSQPVRKLYYNITVTGLSVAVALVVGSIELLTVLGEKLSLRGGVWGFVTSIDLNVIGYLIVGLFVTTWVVAVAFWRLAHVEERWGRNLESAEA